jgi:S-adenosylmethionine:tRNA ribosyltransferase-isomerase
MSTLTESPSTVFDVPAAGFAPAPAEVRGRGRDAVRLLVATPESITHATFRDLPGQLAAGDVVVVNNSATVAGEIDAVGPRGPAVLHLATQLDDADPAVGGASGTWILEVRTAPDASRSVLDAAVGDRFAVGEVELTLLEPYPRLGSSPTGRGNRLWRALVLGDLRAHLGAAGRPIAYGYLDRRYPLAAYQSVFATVPGSAEMPSAGRPFTRSLVTELVSRGIAVAPITLHTGLSSQEAGEAPQPERFEVSAATARLVNAVRAGGGRVVAVGTTVTRALDSAGVDGPRGHAGRATTGRDRPDHGLARPAGVAPAAGRSGRRDGPDPARVRRCRDGRLPVARVRRRCAAAAVTPHTESRAGSVDRQGRSAG